MKKSSIVFFGTGKTSLEALITLAGCFTIEAVITKPNTRTSSGRHIATEVAEWAKTNSTDLYTPANKQELSELFTDRSFDSRVGIVLDYGLIIPETVIDSFELEIINSHFSLLPAWRGADPIRAAILAGDKTTGVTIMKIVPELDAGPILAWSEYNLPKDVTAPELREALSELNCSLLPEVTQLYLDGEIEAVSQDETQTSFTKRVQKSDGELDSSKSADQLEREVRAYSGWPKSYFEFNHKQLIVHRATVSTQTVSPGKLKIIESKLFFGCANGSLEIEEIQPANKPKMNARAFIQGYRSIIEK